MAQILLDSAMKVIYYFVGPTLGHNTYRLGVQYLVSHITEKCINPTTLTEKTSNYCIEGLEIRKISYPVTSSKIWLSML